MLFLTASLEESKPMSFTSVCDQLQPKENICSLCSASNMQSDLWHLPTHCFSTNMVSQPLIKVMGVEEAGPPVHSPAHLLSQVHALSLADTLMYALRSLLCFYRPELL